MTDLNTAGAVGASEAPPIAMTAPTDAPQRMSTSEAASMLAKLRHKQPEKAPEQRQEPAAAEPTESPSHPSSPEDGLRRTSEADAAAADLSAEAQRAKAETQPPGETESADQEANLPSIEPPRSWTKEDKELFTSLPRATQERIAERERSREGDFSRRQQEVTEKGKALQADRALMEQARQRYESALPQLLDALQQQQAGEYADIKTMADVERLAQDDWPRYLKWDLQHKKIAEATRELLASQGRQVSEQRQLFTEFAKRQDELFVEKVPDMADAAEFAKLQTAAISVLTDLGFADAELAALWTGRQQLSLRDHRLQLLIRDGILWRDARQKAKAASTKPVPPVQRPGSSQPKGAAEEQRIQHLTQRLDNASGANALRTAAALLSARRASAR